MTARDLRGNELFPLDGPGTMWIVEKDIPEGLSIGTDPVPRRASMPIEPQEAQAPLVYHEYGVIEQPYSIQTSSMLRSTSFFGWTFCDSTTIVDPTHNCGFEGCPIFHVWGDHPAVGILSEG